MATHQRDALLTSLWNRAYMAALSRDPGALLDDGAVRDAQQLAAVADPGTDPPVARVPARRGSSIAAPSACRSSME